MLDESVDVKKRKELFKEALDAHGRDMKDASAAQGIDRHILGE
jgi:carnitine O-acetyltransferase